MAIKDLGCGKIKPFQVLEINGKRYVRRRHTTFNEKGQRFEKITTMVYGS